MNWEKFISNRFYDSSKNQGWYSGLFSMIGMGVGCFAMIISLSVMKGFETLVHGKLKGFEGVYFFGDYCSGNIWSFKAKDGKAAEFKNRTDEINIADGEFTNYISSFGQDADGEIYIVDYNGAVYKIIAK